MIKAALQAVKVNNYGYASIKVGGAWYGADKSKFVPDAQEGDLVEFEGFKNPKGYDTYKTQTFKKVAGGAAKPDGGSGQVSPGSASTAQRTGAPSSAGSRDTYWADKAKSDEAKQPQIAYQAAYERALGFTDLALRNGAFDALAKAKPTGRLEILQAFVDEQAERIMKAVYAAEVPKAEQAKAAKAVAEAVVEEPTEEETWS